MSATAQAPKREHKAKPGDLIKIYRLGYFHWVVYIGGDEVVGFPGPIKENGDDAFPTFIDGEAEVTREKIWDVIGDCTFRVSNHWDENNKPHEEAVIIKEACERVGQKREYFWARNSSEHFAKELRYGLEMFIRVCAFISKDSHDAKPGDLIEFYRSRYQHWAVYVGNDEVIGLAGQDESDSIFGNVFSRKATVTRGSIWRVMDQDDCTVNNLWDDEYEPFKAEDIVERARKLEGRMLPYSLLSHNCEHFATELRYGVGLSKQVYKFTLGLFS